MRNLFILVLTLLMTSCSLLPPDSQDIAAKKEMIDAYDGMTAEAIFASGCFWCTESDFEKMNGVVTAISGFAGGEELDPSYKQVSAGTTGHREAVLVTYDPSVITYKELVDHFWMTFDPTDDGGSFVDRGFQYTSAVFYGNAEEQKIAEASKTAFAATGKFDKAIVTPILPVTSFFPAEDYHQDYYKENPIRYRYYRSGSGRDDFLKERWGA
ncbi:MAG: peptide-methionine (S)-S-oxide reductase MsrA [bacterium]|nr:peptide-methionine (S)-S-oxide reductase MsrA [bacterium]